jgi:predicted HTH transcriptional regulator
MGVRAASLEAYGISEFSGVNQENEIKILRYLKEHPWVTRNELSHETGLPINIISGRCSDLKDKGLIVEGPRVKTNYSPVSCGTLALKKDYERFLSEAKK